LSKSVQWPCILALQKSLQDISEPRITLLAADVDMVDVLFLAVTDIDILQNITTDTESIKHSQHYRHVHYDDNTGR